MDLSITLIIIGITCIILSFFLKDTSKKLEQELDELSISIYQETNSLKKRLKIVEEELFLEPNFTVKPAKVHKPAYNPVESTKGKQVVNYNSNQINEILVNQVIQLNKQGYPIEEISKLSTLTSTQIIAILKGEGHR